jgi:ribosomal protein S18 acetylase RimI-like enzyme
MTQRTDVVLRAALAADVPALVGLLRKSWLATFAAELPFEAVQAFAADDPARHYAEAMWAQFMVAALDGRVAGMCHVVDDLVAAIHVDPALKRCGIGAALMDEAEQRILAIYSPARLEVLAFNRDAQAFYERRGWRGAKRIRVVECGQEVEALEMMKER